VQIKLSSRNFSTSKWKKLKKVKTALRLFLCQTPRVSLARFRVLLGWRFDADCGWTAERLDRNMLLFVGFAQNHLSACCARSAERKALFRERDTENARAREKPHCLSFHLLLLLLLLHCFPSSNIKSIKHIFMIANGFLESIRVRFIGKQVMETFINSLFAKWLSAHKKRIALVIDETQIRHCRCHHRCCWGISSAEVCGCTCSLRRFQFHLRNFLIVV